MIGEIGLLLLLFVLNGYFALAEIAVIGARKTRLQQWADEGNLNAQAALDLLRDPSDFLSTVQIGVTLVGVVAGAYGGATIAERLSDLLYLVPSFQPYAHVIAQTTVVMVITYLTLIIGELVPKRIAVAFPERIAAMLAPQLKFQSKAVKPIVRFLSRSTDLMLVFAHLKPDQDLPVTEEEIKVMIDQGTQAGVIAKSEQAIVESVFRFGDLNVSSVMTPRTQLTYFDLNDPVEKIRSTVAEYDYSTYPVCDGSLENLVGVVQSKDLLRLLVANEPVTLRSVVRQPILVPENSLASKVLEAFKRSHPHVAIVVDEYGSIQGIVTLSNLLETIVGDISVADEIYDPKIKQREDGSWLVSGIMPISEFKEKLEIDTLPGDDEGHYQTLGGFVIMYLGRIPTVADHFSLEPYRYEVVDMDGNRVDKVLVSRTATTVDPKK